MKKLTKQDGSSVDIANENLEALKSIFPEAFTEDGVNFEVFRELLGDAVSEGDEKYGLTWHGKKKARQIALTPSLGTLRPCPEESVDWDTTQNLFIEGDNLEVLKLLQKSYANKVKMIYIDPPYNTGKEFIYPDKFQDNLDTYLKYTGQKDDEGFKFSSNTESSGRFHTNWLNMMYPRLKLARNLLCPEGVVFISIDDHEVTNLGVLCNEIFGEENCLGLITVVSNLKGRSDDKHFATAHNYLLAYSRGDFITIGVPLPDSYVDDYPQKDANDRRFRLLGLRKRGSGAKREDRPNMYFPIYGSTSNESVSLEKSDIYNVEILPRLSGGTDGRWRWGKDTVQDRIEELVSKSVGSESRPDVFQLDYAEDEKGRKRIKPKTIWTGSEFANETGTLEVKKLIGVKIFDNPKPVGLVTYCLEQATESGDIVLDFFSGSCTAAHAVLDMNKADGVNRKFIMVQLPEPCEEKSAAFKTGYKTIADIAKERIRRAAAKIKEKNPEYEGDLGFKVFKLDSSNIRAWNPDRNDLEQTLIDHMEHLVEGRSEEDVLYELLLKRGVDLTVPIEEKTITGKTVYSIGYGVLFACLDTAISREEVEGLAMGIIAWLKELEPAGDTQAVFRDSAFSNDIAKTNMTAILEQHGITHVRSL